MFNLPNLAATLIVLSAAGVAGAQNGEQSWVDRYDGSDLGIEGSDRGFAVSTDSQGNTIVGGYSDEDTGGSYLAIKYAPDGTRLWVATSNPGSGIGRTMTVDDADNVIVVGSVNVGADFGIVKYDAAGNTLWSRIYGVDLGVGVAFEGVATDAAGAIYAYGNLPGFGATPPTLIVAKYDADGTFSWDLVYASSFATEIAATDGAVYLAGASRVAFRDDDLLVLKVTAAGVVDWARTFGRSGEFAADVALDMAFDAVGNVVAAGTYNGLFDVPGSTVDVAVVRVAADGTPLSEVVYDGPAGRVDEGLALVLDAAGNAIVAGRTTDPDDPGGSNDVLIVKLDPAGTEIWARTYAGVAPFSDTPNDMAIDPFGNVYIVGDVISPGPITEYFTIMYDAAGTLQWEQLYGGSTFDPSHGIAIAVGADLRVSVTGYSTTPETPFNDDDVATVSYASGVVFSDGFESGDVAAWSSSVP